MENKWIVSARRDGENECAVAFTVHDDADTPDIGYPCNVALAVALGCVIKAVSPTDEQPWRLAVVLNLLRWLAAFGHDPQLDEIYEFAAGVWESLDAEAEPCRLPPKGWRRTRRAGHDGPCAAWPVEGGGA